jgi:hypothetical protein
MYSAPWEISSSFPVHGAKHLAHLQFCVEAINRTGGEDYCILAVTFIQILYVQCKLNCSLRALFHMQCIECKMLDWNVLHLTFPLHTAYCICHSHHASDGVNGLFPSNRSMLLLVCSWCSPSNSIKVYLYIGIGIFCISKSYHLISLLLLLCHQK